MTDRDKELEAVWQRAFADAYEQAAEQFTHALGRTIALFHEAIHEVVPGPWHREIGEVFERKVQERKAAMEQTAEAEGMN